MSRVAIQDTITSPATGIAVPSATVTVRDGDSLGDLSTIYLQREGGDTANNPISVGDPGFTNDGELAVYADPGLYWVEVDTGGVTRSYELDLVNAEDQLQAASDIRQRVIYVATIADLQSLDTAPLPDGQQVSVTDQDTGGVYRYDESATSGGIAPDDGDGRWLLVRANAQAITFNNVQQMKDFAPLYEGAKARTLGYYEPGDGGGNDYEIVESGTGSNFGFLYEQLSGSGLEAKLLGGGIMEDKTAYIPSDYGTLQEAIDDLSKLRVTQGVTISLVVEDGHEPESGISVSDGDYARFFVQSASASGNVVLSSLFSGRFIECNNGIAPVLDCYVIAHSGVDRVYSMFGSIGKVTPGNGGEGTSGRILYGNQSNIQAVQTVWRNAGDSVYFSGGSGAALGGVTIEGFTVTSNGALAASRGSSIEAAGALIKDCWFAVEAKRAGSTINLSSATLENIGRIGVRATRGATVSFDGSSIVDLGPETDGAGLEAYGAIISAQEGVSISYSSTPPSGDAFAVRSSNDGSVACPSITITNARTGLYATDNGQIDASNCNITNASSIGARARQGGFINVRSATISESGDQDLRVTEGSIISAVGCTTTAGNPSVSDTNLDGFGGLNNIGSNRGIIFG